jgi:hypothetical protein
MKRYYNSTTKEWYTEGNSITKNISNGVFSGIPSEQRLTEWGFVEYIEPTPTPEELLERAKANKIAELENYNDSDAVNEFTIQGNPMWLTFDERNRLQKAVDAKEAMGKTSMTKVWNGVEFPFPLATWKQMLAALEDYAFDCQNVTDGHKAAINALESIEEVEAYQFSGYPEKLSFGEQP